MRNRDRLIGIGEPVLPRYERIAFEKVAGRPQGQPLAAFVCPGHPLLDATIDITGAHRDLLARGTVLVDERTPATNRGCSSTWSTPFRTPASPAPATDVSFPSECYMSRSMLPATPGICITHHIWTIVHCSRRAGAESDPAGRRSAHG